MHGGDPCAARDGRGTLRVQARVLLAGQLTRPVEIVPRGYARIAGAHLRPHGAYDLLHVPQHLFKDRVVDLRSVDVDLAETLRRTVASRTDGPQMIAALIAVLSARAPARRVPCAATQAVAVALALKGMITVAGLSRASHVTARQLERLFRERVGISPKLFLRIVRFQEVLRATRTGPNAAWAAVALEHGYYDQAHFINDFKAFVGRTPGDWKIGDDSLAAIFSARRRPAPSEVEGPPADRVAFFQDSTPATP